MAIPLFSARKTKQSEDAPPIEPVEGVHEALMGGLDLAPPAEAVGEEPASRPSRAKEAAALLIWTSALFLVLALLSFEGDPTGGSTGPNWVGPVGESAAHAAALLVGLAAWSVPLELLLLGVPLVRGRKSTLTPARFAGDLLVVVTLAAMVQVGWPEERAFGDFPASGAIGELFGEFMRSLFSTAGSFLVGFACLGLILIGRASFSFIAMLRKSAQLAARAVRAISLAIENVRDAWRAARAIEAGELTDDPRILEDLEALADVDPEACAEAIDDTSYVAPENDETSLDVVIDPEIVESASIAATDEMRALRLAREEPAPPKKQRVAAEPDTEPAAAPQPTKKAREPKAPTIVDTSAALAKEKPARQHRQHGRFELPKLDFLVGADDSRPTVDRSRLLADADLLVKTLADYGVSGKVVDILPGPTVTTFEVAPAAGTKVSKVASLADDLALALARKVRIIAPIPGKNRIGFELPNDKRVPVNLRDLVEDRRFAGFKGLLPVVLGRDIVGNPVYADLAAMPHMIVAGATGAGKSVGLNVMLTSLLYRRTPDELRMLMIDPKVVELAPFDRIPHMLLPVVTDMKHANLALKWAVDEMERRYQLFADAGTKNLQTYNAWVGRVLRGEAKNPLPKQVTAKDPLGGTETIDVGPGAEGEQALPEVLPSIVIVVDEFADLMMQQGKEVEASVARLAQKARAAGMHVILATQRPSVDVITGMIKANFPTRVAFRVAQKVDSRTILDEQGAEHLLGRGDMLIKLNGTNETRRVQCPWVSEEEVQTVTDFLRAQGEPVYDESILKPRDEDGGDEGGDSDAEADPLYDQAVAIVVETRRCSTSWLQRKLSLGYNRAARIVETMEKRGIVGPSRGSKEREILVENHF